MFFALQVFVYPGRIQTSISYVFFLFIAAFFLLITVCFFPLQVLCATMLISIAISLPLQGDFFQFGMWI